MHVIGHWELGFVWNLGFGNWIFADPNSYLVSPWTGQDFFIKTDNRRALADDSPVRGRSMERGFKAIAELFTRYGEDMVRWARRTLRSETDAEDVVQEVMLFLLGAPHTLARVERLGAWLYTLVRRKCVDVIRREGRRRIKEADSGLGDLFEGTDPSEWIEREEFSDAFARTVDSLPGTLRSVFIRNGLEDKTFREISEETGVPKGTLMARKKRAVETLREALLREGFLE